MKVSVQMYSLALVRHSNTINLSEHKGIDLALKDALMNSGTLNNHIAGELNVEPRQAGESYTLKMWKAKRNFGFGSASDKDLSMSIGHARIYIYVKVLDVKDGQYNCQVNLSMSDLYDFAHMDEEQNTAVKLINNSLGYVPQEKGIIHPYRWHYSCSFEKKYPVLK